MFLLDSVRKRRLLTFRVCVASKNLVCAQPLPKNLAVMRHMTSAISFEDLCFPSLSTKFDSSKNRFSCKIDSYQNNIIFFMACYSYQII